MTPRYRLRTTHQDERWIVWIEVEGGIVWPIGIDVDRDRAEADATIALTHALEHVPNGTPLAF